MVERILVKSSVVLALGLSFLAGCGLFVGNDDEPQETGEVNALILGYDQSEGLQIPAEADPGPIPSTQLPNRRFFVIGDQGAQCSGCTLQRRVADGMSRWQDGDMSTSGRNAHFVLGTGDNFYPAGVPSRDSDRFQTNFEDVYTRDLFPLTFYMTLGNHDYLGITQAQINYHGRGSGRWYMKSRFYTFSQLIPALEAGGEPAKVQFFALDTNQLIRDDNHFRMNGAGAYKADTRQLKWLKKSLRTHADARWKIAFGHHSPYSTGHHRNNKILIDTLVPVLESGGVDIVFAGHDHDLQVLGAIGKQSKIYYFVSGAGSKARNAFLVRGSDDVDAAANSEFVHTPGGFMWCRVTAEDFVVAVCDSDGKLLHMFGPVAQ